jgi:hypothetical protein
MLAPTGVFRQSAKKGIVLPFHTIIMTQSALFCNSVEKVVKSAKNYPNGGGRNRPIPV